MFEHNGAQSVRLEIGTINFKNYFKKIPAPFKIYADCEFSYECSYPKKYQDHIPRNFVVDKFTKPIVVFRSENAAYEFIKAILSNSYSMNTVTK